LAWNYQEIGVSTLLIKFEHPLAETVFQPIPPRFSISAIAAPDPGAEAIITTLMRPNRKNKMPAPSRDKSPASIADLRASGRINRAETYIKQALRANPSDANALHQSGLIARDKGKHKRAIQLLEKAVAAHPSAAEIQCDLGLALKAVGRFDEAIEIQRLVTEQLPTSARAWSNYGTALLAANRHAEAIAALIQSVALELQDPELHYNLGNALLSSGDPATAEGAFLRALRIQPNHIGALTNLGSSLKDQGQLAEAEELLRGAAVLDPDNADLNWNLAIILLSAGKFDEGSAAYEVRRTIPGFAIKPQKIRPWSGTPLAGKRLLVHAEQGLGDTIQFCRYLTLLGDDASDIVFQAPRRLLPLMQTLVTDIEIVDDVQPGRRCDVEAPLLSLPHLIGPATPFMPDSGHYLRPDPDRQAQWEERLKGDDEPAIAICWQGNPDYRYDYARSVPLAAFEPLTRLTSSRLISVQQGTGCEQIADVAWRDRITMLGEEIDQESAFIDTAAILSAVDLVITSDTSIAHLAGALGVPVWLALAKVPDWRWGLTGETTPWYDSMRLFRQQTRGDWGPVFDGIALALKEEFS
jgi:Flp pilus assembly protein TadD